MFLLLGIGADDCFYVFVDAWKQAAVVLGSNVDLESRMAWTYRRAVRAMSVTSFTTAIAFFCTASSPIMPISSLGIWAGLLVLLQSVLVITVFPSAIIIWHRFWRKHRWYRCWRRHDPDGEENEQEVSTSSAYVRGIEEEQSGLGWDQREHTSDEESGSVHRKRFAARKDGELRPIERFFNGPWTKLTRVARWPLVVLGVVLFGVSIWLATLLEIPVESERFLPENHPLILASDLFTKGFPSFDGFENVAIRAIWGLSGIDRSKTNKYVPDDLGEPMFNTSFSLLSKVAQQRILEACDFFSDTAKELVTNSSTIENKIDCLAARLSEMAKGL